MQRSVVSVFCSALKRIEIDSPTYFSSRCYWNQIQFTSIRCAE